MKPPERGAAAVHGCAASDSPAVPRRAKAQHSLPLGVDAERHDYQCSNYWREWRLELGLEKTLVLVPAKQNLTNSCVSACIATAIGSLSRDRELAFRARERLEEKLGNNRVTLDDAARIANEFFALYEFNSCVTEGLDMAIEVAKKAKCVVILGLDAALFYGEPIGPRWHAVVVVRTTDYPELQGIDQTKRFWIQSLSHDQGIWDPAPGMASRTFNLAEAADAFVAAGGQYLTVRAKQATGQ
jgi:hypothetical protein